MVNKWVTRRIGEIGRVVTGKTPPTKDKGNFGGPYPFITIPDLDGRAVIDQTARTLSAKGASVVKSSLLPPGAVLMSCIATIGKCGITTEPSFTNQQINSVIVDDKTDSRFLYYVFTQLGHELEVAGGGGSIYTNVSKTRFSNIEITLPSDISEQRAIAHILGTLDDKIELNRRMNETLEEMARAIFKSWFVDFDPVRAKMDGSWRRGESLPGMPAEMYDLFPSRLVDSELGEIPEGWGMGCLADIADFPRRGVSPSALPEDTLYIGLEHMPRHSIALTQWENARKITSNKSMFNKGELLFGKLRPYFHKVGIAPIDGICSTDIVVLAPKLNSWSVFTLLSISTDEFVGYTDRTSTGTRMPRTSWKTMSNYKICLPPNKVIKIFQNITQTMIDRIVANVHESRTLSGLRDTLLPKLISGELRVPDAELIF